MQPGKTQIIGLSGGVGGFEVCARLVIRRLPHVVGIVAQTHVSGAKLVIRSLPHVVGIVAQTNVSGARLVIRN